MHKVEALADQGTTECEPGSERIHLSANDVAKRREETRRLNFEFVATGFCLEVGDTPSKPAKLRRVRVLFNLYAACCLNGDIKDKIAVDGIGYIDAVDCVSALPGAGSLNVVRTTPGVSSDAL